MPNHSYTLGIVSPSAPITFASEKEWRVARLEAAETNLRARSFKTIRSRYLLECAGFEAGTNEQRLSDLHTFYQDPEVSFLVATRGGRASSSLLKSLDFDLITKSSKSLVGFSDLTALLNAIYAKTGINQIHGPMMTAGLEGEDPDTWESFLAALNKAPQSFSTPMFGEWWREGYAEGTLLGGNLVTLQCLLGTEYEPEWDNAILFWEEVGEPISKIWRILYHLENCGVLQKINGMIIGHLSGVDGGHPEEQAKADDLRGTLMEVLGNYNFPILKTILFGHGVKTQISLPVGGTAILSRDQVTFKFSE